VCDARGFTIGELIIVVMVIAVLGALALPLLKQARMSSNESSAIASMRSIVGAQASYASFNLGFAESLDALARRCSGMTDAFISQDLNRNGAVRNGYVFTVGPGRGAEAKKNDCNGVPTQTSFYGSASPHIPYDTGTRAFAVNPTSIIWQNSTPTPPAEPFVVGGTVSLVSK
jgi:type IV pilus assembly protein PilA